eukprot:m.132473 g.132473  ORF g.132473 m.132473 type:complete len:55 (-) comp16486_c0_seq2:1328-1492(-)
MGLNVWLLGRFFQCEGSTLSPEFETAFANLPWFTYRNGFPSFPVPVVFRQPHAC